MTRHLDATLTGRSRFEDRLTVALLAFFIAAALTVELYFVFHYRDVHTRDDLFARAYQLYSIGDDAYYGQGDVHLPFALETINVFFTQILNALLIWAVAKRLAWRYPLQLAVSAYVAYSVVLYLWHAHVSGYPGMREKSPWAFFIFVAPNLPWLLGNLCLAQRAFTAITRRFRSGS
jgi:hypothetical protein